MKAEDLRNKQIHELNTDLISLLKMQFGIRMQLALQQPININKLKSIKKDIARIKTVLTEKANNYGK